MAIEKEKLQKVLGICCGGLCVAVVYYQFVIDGIQLSSLSKLNKEVAEYQLKLDKARDNDKKLKVLVDAAKKDSQFLADVGSRVVTGDPVAWLWREMGDFGEQQKLPRLAVMPGAGAVSGMPESDSFSATPATLNLYCGYHKLGEFVRDLENRFATLQVQQLEIVGGSETTPDTHTVRVQFQIFTAKEDKSNDPAHDTKIAQGPEAKE